MSSMMRTYGTSHHCCRNTSRFMEATTLISVSQAVEPAYARSESSPSSAWENQEAHNEGVRSDFVKCFDSVVNYKNVRDRP